MKRLRSALAPLAGTSLLLATAIVAIQVRPAVAQFDTASEAARYYDEDLDDIEWEAGEGYHAEEWYDPSDWFDLDEGVEYEDDSAYGYYGAGNDWYYDYNDDNYTSYDYGDAGNYNSASTYYDYDDDGIYDAYATYYDWDNDGSYDDYNYYSFADLNGANNSTQNSTQNASQTSTQDTRTADQEARQQAQQAQRQKSPQEARVAGRVQQTKKVRVRQGQNLVAQVKTQQGTVNVDLGPASEADKWNISDGTQLTARGPMTQVGDKQVLLAKSVKIDQNEQSVDRSTAKFTGTIASLKKVGVRGTQHQLAMVNTREQQKKVLVDMGPTDQLSQNFSEGDEVTVHGVPIRAGQRPVVMAQQVDYQGQTIRIKRGATPDQQAAARAQSSSRSR